MKDKGFTLIELIISIAIIGIIVLIITGALRLGFRSVESGEKKIEAHERMRSSLAIIDSQIQSEIPLTYDDEGERKYYFLGERGFMQFASNYSLWGMGQGYVIATYTVETGENGKQILNATENTVGLENTRTAKLFDTFDAIYFEFFYRDPTEEQGTWVEEWTDEFNMPEKIRIHLIEGMRDFSMIIPLRARGSLAQTGGGQFSSPDSSTEQEGGAF
jgi:prepilin-type N-terminal cleavage/methylation domain-containing protein